MLKYCPLQTLRRSAPYKDRKTKGVSKTTVILHVQPCFAEKLRHIALVNRPLKAVKFYVSRVYRAPAVEVGVRRHTDGYRIAGVVCMLLDAAHQVFAAEVLYHA